MQCKQILVTEVAKCRNVGVAIGRPTWPSDQTITFLGALVRIKGDGAITKGRAMLLEGVLIEASGLEVDGYHQLIVTNIESSIVPSG
ncbi:MAG: hypothetical protein AAGD32_04910 [Planctomycetota bacterium]